MKKLIAMIGAVAMGFGLFAADSVVTFATSFEAPDVGVDGTTFIPGADWTWEGDPFTLGQYDGDAYDYTRSGEGRRQDVFKGTSDQFNYLPLKTENKELKLAVTNNVLDQLVKFTGFEDPQTNLVEGAKIAVWMSGVDADADEGIKGETNLYVTCAKVTGTGVEPIALKLKEPKGNAWATEKWYRLTIQNIGDIYKQEPSEGHRRCGFIVYVDGKLVEAEAAAKQLIVYDSELTDDARMYMGNGQLFPAFDTTDLAFNSVSYKGIGAIDDIIVDNVGPEFAQVTDCKFTIDPGDGLDVVSVCAGQTPLTPGEGGEYTVTKGTTVTITWGLVPGYKVMGGGSLEPTVVQISSDGMAIKPSDYGIDVQWIVATVVNANDLTATNVFAASELYTMINELVDGDTATFLEAVEIYYDDDTEEGDQAYSFSENTTIAVTTVDAATKWTITSVSDFDWIGDYVGAPADLVKEYVLADADSTVELAGDVEGKFEAANVEASVAIGVSGTLTAAILAIDESITLSGEGKVISQDDTLEIAADEGEVEVLEDTPGWYTYQVRRVDYATFTVTYNSDEVDNVSVKTNGADVAIIEDPEGDYYQVFSNEVVTIAAESKDAEKRVWIKRNGVKIDGTFTADANGDKITIGAAAPVTITLPNLPIDGVEDLVVSQSVDGVEWTLVEDNKIDDGNQYVVIAIPSEDYRADNPIKDGTAASGEDIEVTEEDVKAKIAKIAYVAQIVRDDGATTNKYETLQAALDDAAADEVIEVIDDIDDVDVTVSNKVSISAKDFTLTGKSGAYAVKIVTGGELTVSGGSYQTAEGSTASLFLVGNDAGVEGGTDAKGKLIISSGTFGGANAGNLVKVSKGSLELSGGIFQTSGSRAIKADGPNATVSITGTQINAEGKIAFAADNGGQITIDGGLITGKIQLEGSNDASKITVADGTIDGEILRKDGTAAGTITIPGDSKATFDSDQTAWCAEGYKTKLNSETPARYAVVAIQYATLVVVADNNVASYTITNKTTNTVIEEGLYKADADNAEEIEAINITYKPGYKADPSSTLAITLVANTNIVIKSIQDAPAPIPHDDKIEYTGITAANETEACDKVQIKSPDTAIVDDATYAGYFNKSAEATDVGVYTVTATLKPEITQAADETAELADQLDDLIHIESTTIVLEKAKPGLWYSLNQGQTIAGREEDARVQATSEGVHLTGKHFNGSGFYQIMVNTAPNLKD